jgi:hypothetical protein
MRRSSAIGWVGTWTLVIGCGVAPGDDTERTAVGRAPLGEAAAAATPQSTEIVIYGNPSPPDDEPPEYPVLISYAGGVPSALFRFDCGSNNATLFDGFGYSYQGTELLKHFDSLATLRAHLRSLPGVTDDLPIRPLRCDGPSPILQVYRAIDADPAKGRASYYMRLTDDPGTIFTVGCANVLEALAWPGASDAGRAAIPVNAAGIDGWRGRGIVQREVGCYTTTFRPLPPVKTDLPIVAAPGPIADQTQLVRVTYRFDGIPSPSALYLVSNGDPARPNDDRRGYAIDCGSNQDQIKIALGFPVDRPVPELSTGSALFAASHPGEQPILRCTNGGGVMFDTLDEQPSTRYFKLDGAPTLLHFLSADATAFFEASIPPQADGSGVLVPPQARRVPRQSVPYLYAEGGPNDPTPIRAIGTDPTAGLVRSFQRVVGRSPSDAELATFRDRYIAHVASTLATPAAAEAAMTEAIETFARDTELDLVIRRALAASSPRPSTDVDVDGHRLDDYLKDKIGGRYGEPLRANAAEIRAFVEARTLRTAPRMRQHLLATYGVVADGADRAFFRDLMETPDRADAYAALQVAGNRALFADAAAVGPVLSRGVALGKRDNAAKPGLDGAVAYAEDVAFFRDAIAKSSATVFQSGIYTWIHDRVAQSHAASRSDLQTAYGAVYACSPSDSTCPRSDVIAAWTAQFYAPENAAKSFAVPVIERAMESHLTSCAAAGSSCTREIEDLFAAMCGGRTTCGGAQAILPLIRAKSLFANGGSIRCYLDTRATATCRTTFLADRVALRTWDGHYVVAEGGGGGVVNGNRTAIGPWETFRLLPLDGGKFALLSSNGSYVTAEGGGGGAVNANREAVVTWEQLTPVATADGRTALATFDGHYVVAISGGGDKVLADRTAIGPWEKFVIVPLPSP